MKKIILLIILTILFPCVVLAADYSVNATGSQDKPHNNSSSSGTCTDSKYYWLGFTQDAYKFSGLRISFYDSKTNKQVGRSVDVYNWGPSFYWQGSWDIINNTTAQELDTKYGFVSYKKETNHTYYFSKVDYSSNRLYSTKAKENLVYGDYYFYFDREAFAKSTFSSCYCAKIEYSYAQKHYQYAKDCYSGKPFYENKIQKIYKELCNKVVSGPLFYTMQDGNKSAFRNYFRTPEVMKRYLHLAGADNLINIKTGEYKMIAEPVASLNACSSAAYAGNYTASDLGYIYEKIAKIGFNDSTKIWPGRLALSSSTSVGGYTYTATSVINSKGRDILFSEDYFLSEYGIGMAVINGKEVCYPDCEEKKPYKIVYRTVDLANPFLNIDGNKRTLKKESNWYQKQNTIDASVYLGTPKYTITLTPTKIKQIRNDNKTVNYQSIMQKYSASSTFRTSSFKSKFGL